jgi:uncharacterized protein YecT (DUF1311 family)
MRKMISNVVYMCLCFSPILCLGQNADPCPDGPNVSNAEMRECYTNAQISMNKMADELAARASAKLRGSTPKEEARYGPVILQALEDAATKLDDSQLSWHAYRDQYCDAVKFSFTTGSGSGTAMEECLYRTALERVRQLRLDFPDPAGRKEHGH